MPATNSFRYRPRVPVTHAHPAAVLPFIRWRMFNASALIIGSLMPDLPSFLLLETERASTHSLFGVLIYGIPAGLITYGLYQTFLRLGFLALLDAEGTDQLNVPPVNTGSRLKSFLTICFSLLIGALTHIFWDGFTHYTGWASVCFPALKEPVISGSSLPVFKVMQYLSGVLGTLVVCWSAWRTLRRDSRFPWDSTEWRKRTTTRCLKYLTASIVIGSLAAGLVLRLGSQPIDLKLVVRYLVVCSTDMFLLFLLIRGASIRFPPRQHG